MIFGIGTDVVAIARMSDLWQRHGERALERLLAVGEREDCRCATDPGRFLAKRFAAKEALGKALGTGIRAPVLLDAISIAHDPHGKPYFEFAPELSAYVEALGFTTHVSISDEREYAVAFVVVQRQ
jgi:holo-[acyl-carrier protein] synthase